jgi:hypothetical protein
VGLDEPDVAMGDREHLGLARRPEVLQVRRNESPTGYSSAGCSPAKPASASPVTDHRGSIPMQRLAVIQCRAGRVRGQRGVISTLRAG